VPRKVFVAGEILTAADVNANLMDQAVQVFDDASARDAAIPSPTEGMIAYLKDTDSLVTYGTAWAPAVNTATLQDASVTTGKIAGSAITEALIADDAVTLAKLGSDVALGKILQVVQTVKTNTFTTSSTSFTDVTGLTASITPTSTSSKILIMTQLSIAISNNVHYATIRLAGGNSGDFVGDAAGNRIRAITGGALNNIGDSGQITLPFNYVDSPATTSSVTYSIQVRTRTVFSSDTIFVNRTKGNVDNDNEPRGASSLILMEVAG
jgi:hypothetical protein